MQPPVALLAAGMVLFSGVAISTAQTNYQRILSFGPYPVSGTSPRAKLIEASNGWLYGATYAGGSNNLGTLFRIAKDGSGFAVLWHFADGDFPYAGLTEGTNGALFGTTSGGGSHNGGTVFKINKDGSGFLTIQNLNSSTTDGNAPVSGLLQASNGLFYGTCSGGGSNNLGTVFAISADGSTYRTVHSFAGKVNGDGANPASALTTTLNGGLYGTTQSGGNNNMGTVFRLNEDESGYSLLHSFAGSPGDGRVAMGGLVQGPDGLLYGTTQYGGANDSGTIFKVDTNGNNYAVVKNFMGSGGGSQPLARLAVSSDGALIGDTRFGGPNDLGLVFRFHPSDSTYSVLHNFTGTNGDGSQPFAPLILGSDGALYGSTFYGGDYSSHLVVGTLFRLLFSAPQVNITSISNSLSGPALTFAGGAAGLLYRIQATPSLSPPVWQNISTNTAWIDGTFQFTDSASSTFSNRYYRSAYP